MAKVDAIEIADGHRAAAKRFGEIVKGAKEDHSATVAMLRLS